MREFIEEYGGIVVMVLIGLGALKGMLEIIKLVSGI